MRIKLLVTFFLLFGLSFTVAAQRFPDEMLEQGEMSLTNPELAFEVNFEDDRDWVSGSSDTYEAGVNEDDEVYIINVEYEENLNLVWAQDDRIFENVVIQVETEQLSRESNNGYGVMCRADPSNNGDGYRFYVSGDGYIAITRREGSDYEFLVDWTFRDDIVNTGRDDNDITVVCVDEYLALYVNDELVAEVEDDRVDEGVVGLIATIFEEGEDVEIAFDDLVVWEVESDGSNSGRGNTSGSDVDELEDDVANMLEDGDVQIELDDLLLVETWDEIGDWEEFDTDNYVIEVDDDRYVIQNNTDANLVWALNLGEEYDDIVMTIEAEHLSDADSNGFGLMCRVNPENFEDGYSFLIRPNGTYSMGYWQENSYFSLMDDDFAVSNDIDDGDSYTITVVCVDEYFALYVDGELVEEVEDDTFDEGYVGVATISFEGEVEVGYDNLVIWEGKD